MQNIYSSTSLYDVNVTSIKREGHFIRVVNLSACRKSGFETLKKHSVKNTVNDSKLESNLHRAKSIVRQYARCNTWNYFCTFTIDPEKFDRYDLKTFYKSFSKFINNYNQRQLKDCNYKFLYLLIPEFHKDGAIHFHGLVSGIRPDDLYVNKFGYLTWRQYEEKFGFISMGVIQNLDACSLYITKYITKDLSNTINELGAHLYYCSKRLNKAELIARSTNLFLKNCDFDYEDANGNFRVKTFDSNLVDYRDYVGGLDETF